MSESFSSKLKDLQTKYVSSSTSKNDDANLLVQMNLYNNEKIGSNLNDLEEIFISEKKRLETLKNDDPETCRKTCEQFLQENDEPITKQLDTIIELDKNIKNVVAECEEIELQEEKLNEMIKDPKYVQLAEKIKKVRSSVDSLNHFLVRKKISNYKN